MKDFQTTYGPWALVAGASEGLGAAFAESLAARGLNLILVARREPQLMAFAEELRHRYAVAVETQALDLAEPESGERFIRSLTKMWVCWSVTLLILLWGDFRMCHCLSYSKFWP